MLQILTERKWLMLIICLTVGWSAAATEVRASENSADVDSESEFFLQSGAADIQRDVLDEKSLVLEFYLADDQSYLRLIGKNEADFYILPPRQQIESRIDELRELLLAREQVKDESIEDYQTRIAEADRDYWLKAHFLSDCLLGPIADKIIGKRLIIVPDGKLHYLSLAALPLPNSDNSEPLLLYNETTYEPSAAYLQQLTKDRKPPSTAGKDLLVFTDPVFTREDARFSAENKIVENYVEEAALTDKYRFAESLNSLSRLTASKTEGDSITSIVGVATTDDFSGFPASREHLLGIEIGEYKIVHFATHSFIDENHPELSGIVLSRFDEKGRKLDELFRLRDIYDLKLDADLVVLSACETGLGKEVKGAGWQSLSNAFLQTGAKSVMASLWKVEDTATLELMKNFYGAMVNEHLTPSESLRRAQIELRRNPQYQSPFYWAAFTVEGDFQTVPQLSSSHFNRRIYPLLIFPFGLIGLVISFRCCGLFNRKIINKI